MKQPVVSSVSKSVNQLALDAAGVKIEVGKMKVVGITDIGMVRKNNEDAFWIDKEHGLFIVCDGMGGHRGGEVASRMAVERVRLSLSNPDQAPPAHRLIKSIQEANKAIYQAGQKNQDLYEMGTTITAILHTGKHLIIANVGDSGAFLIRSDGIKKITRDHTLAEQMLSNGMLKPEELRDNAYNHILTRALGIDVEVEIDVFEQEVQSHDILLMCSDGLTDMLDHKEIFDLIKQAGNNIDRAAGMLREAALKKGGYDNITIVLIWFN